MGNCESRGGRTKERRAWARATESEDGSARVEANRGRRGLRLSRLSRVVVRLVEAVRGLSLLNMRPWHYRWTSAVHVHVAGASCTATAHDSLSVSHRVQHRALGASTLRGKAWATQSQAWTILAEEVAARPESSRLNNRAEKSFLPE